MMQLWSELGNRLTFIVGSAKNAGKTTFMNLAARSLRPRGPVAMLTIGVDGEGRDQVFGTPKPLVPVEAGDWIVTTQTALNASMGLFRVTQVYPVSTVLGRLVLARCERGDYCELVGPETNSQLQTILSDLVLEQNIKTILVDGAVNRITQIGSHVGAGIVDVLKVTPGTLTSAEEHVRLHAALFSLPTVEEGLAALDKRQKAKLPQHDLPESWVEVEGALTPSKLATIPKGTKGIVVENLSRVFLPASSLAHLPCPLHVRQRFPLRAMILNGFDVDEAGFAERFKGLPIADRLVVNLQKELSA
jgi:hypothetical protein